MTGRDDRSPGVAGGLARHRPVLLEEVLTALAPERGGLFIDGTFGAGGYSRALLERFPEAGVLAIDRDPEAVAAGASLVAELPGRLTLVESRFGRLDEAAAEAGFAGAAGVVLDLGVSSMQLDEAERGFSFRGEGPLDMRMEMAGPSAADAVNQLSEAELADIFFHYGEERRAKAVARALIERRRRAPLETTRELAELVAGIVGYDPGGIHPATRVFQALRIYVNDELGQLVEALHAAERILEPGGRLAVVTFHSLEDRIVKQFLAARSRRSAAGSRHRPQVEADAPTFALVRRGPIVPGDAEIRLNPRARSAKLRVGERSGNAIPGDLPALTSLAELPRTAQVARGGRR